MLLRSFLSPLLNVPPRLIKRQACIWSPHPEEYGAAVTELKYIMSKELAVIKGQKRHLCLQKITHMHTAFNFKLITMSC